MSESTSRKFCTLVFASLAVLLIAVPAFSASSGRTLPNVQILGPENQAKQISVTFWLKQHDQAGLDELVRQMYDRNSPNYHHWLTPQQYQARFAPSASEMATVRQYLAENNLQVVRTDKFNLAVTARGTVRDIERATGVQINRVLINGKANRLPSGELAIPGAAGKLVAHVQGLTDTRYQSHMVRPIDPDTGKPVPGVAVSRNSQSQQYFNAYCLRATKTINPTSPQGPYAMYTGTHYGADSIHNGPPDISPCGYDTQQVQTAYGLNSLYAKGLDGTGQTVVIVDAFGNDTIMSDINFFAQINGLPAYDQSNFTIYYPTGPTNCGGNTCGWDVETSLDVEWSHSIAPGAKIALVVAADNSSTNLDLSVLYAIETMLGSVVSNSYGIPEAELISLDPGELTVENLINEAGAALGISVNFSSGDNGDFVAAYGSQTVSMPSASPFATSVGGTSLFLKRDSSIKLQTGWGTNLTRLTTYQNQPLIPPTFIGFNFGAGGGPSGYFPKPFYQARLSGGFRQVPDIGWLADPFTGGEVVDTGSNGVQVVAVVGGTSLACPMFSGLWAIATQAAGTWLGQAAPFLYTLPADAITDITAVNGPNNATGLTDVPPNPPTNYAAADLVAPVGNSTTFVSMLYHGTSTRWYAITFGTDTSLTTGPGWDNVTGVGVPNTLNFVLDIAGANAPKP